MYYRYSEEMIRNEAQRHTELHTFIHESYWAWEAAKRRGIFEDVTKHMFRRGDLFNRYVYVIWEGTEIYLGLTINPQARIVGHKKNGIPAVKKLLSRPGSKWKTVSPLLSAEKARELERGLIRTAKKFGWSVLNIKDGGELGYSPRKYSQENLRKEALKYQSRRSFEDGSPKYYNAALYWKCMDEICQHMRPKLCRWTEKMIFEEAKKYSTRKEFVSKAAGAVDAAQRLGIMKQACAHMKHLQETWTEEKVREIAKQFTCRTYLFRKHPGAYAAAKRLGILEDLYPKAQTPHHYSRLIDRGFQRKQNYH